MSKLDELAVKSLVVLCIVLPFIDTSALVISQAQHYRIDKQTGRSGTWFKKDGEWETYCCHHDQWGKTLHYLRRTQKVKMKLAK